MGSIILSVLNHLQVLSLADHFLRLSSQATVPGGNQTTMAASSPFSNYDAGVAIYMLLVGFLVVLLLGGGFLIVNLGLLSKRPQDRIGKRTPSELGFLRNQTWPEEPFRELSLPAEEDDEVPPRRAA